MSQATQEQVIAFTKLVQEFSIPIWIDGGWGVDALLGTQTRPHSDFDLIINKNDLTRLKELLISKQFELCFEPDVMSIVFNSKSGLAIDVHHVNFDKRGFGIFELPDNREWPFPPSAFRGSGNIGGMFVNCLSPDAQVQCHAQGYQPTEKDLAATWKEKSGSESRKFCIKDDQKELLLNIILLRFKHLLLVIV